MSRMQNFGRRETELTSSFALRDQLITLRSLCHKQFSVANFMAKVSVVCSITLFTYNILSIPDLGSIAVDGGW